MSETQLDRKDLKIQALLEKLSQQDSQIADLRVELTYLEQHVRELSQQQQQQVQQTLPQGEIVQGEVVPDVSQATNN